MVIIIFIPFLLYILTICPTIYWRDSPEFINVAYTLGISHPAGSPTYSMISKIFTFLPFSSISFKINLVSLFFALLAIIFTCKVIQTLLNIYYPRIGRYEINLIAILCSLLLVIMPSFWLKAIVSEVYAMNAFFLTLILFLLFNWFIKNDYRYLLLAVFLYGLSSGVHAGVVLFLPGFLLFFLLVQFKKEQFQGSNACKKKILNSSRYDCVEFSQSLQRNDGRSSIKLFVLITFFFLLGFSIYLYLPIRSIQNPEFDWGNPENIRNFISHISDRKDAGSHFKNIPHIYSLTKNIVIFLRMILSEITFMGVFLLILGMAVHFKKDRKSFLLLFFTAFINLLFYFTTTFANTRDGNLFIPSFVIFVIWIGLGICFLRNIKTKILPQINFRKLAVPVILLFIFFSVLKNYQKIEKSSYYLTEDFSKELYVNLEPNSILFSYQHWFLNRYFQDVENLRPDLVIMNLSDIRRPDVFNPVTKVRYPMIKLPEIASRGNSFYDFFPRLIKDNIKERKMFVDLNIFILNTGFLHLLPYKKYLVQIVDKEQEKSFDKLIENYYQELQVSINNDISKVAFFLDQEQGIKTYYNIFLLSLADFLKKKGQCEKALLFLNLAESLTDEKTKGIPLMKGICLAELGKYDESALLFKNLLIEYPDDKSILTNLGNLYFKMKHYETAEMHIKKALHIDDNLPKAHFILGMIYSAQNKIDESIIEYQKAIVKTKNVYKKENMRNIMEMILEKKIKY